MLTLGLVINPLAGVGGPAAMKGSDGSDALRRARELGIEPRAALRVEETFHALQELLAAGAQGADAQAGSAERALKIVCCAGAMGADALSTTDFQRVLLPDPVGHAESSAADTRAVVGELIDQVDLLVFAGGDGTARDVLDAFRAHPAEQVRNRLPVLGIPAGVKMHSGVFATSPQAAARLLFGLVQGSLVGAVHAEVKDIDEAALRRGEVMSQRYGELLVPAAAGYLQHVKSGGKEVEELVLIEIAADINERDDLLGEPLVVGPGSTCLAVKQQLLAGADSGHDGDPLTLLGFDVLHRGRLLSRDAHGPELERLQSAHPNLNLLISFSRGQGFLFGRGNQQLTRRFLRGLSPERLLVVGSRTKLASLSGRPLLVDSGDASLNAEYSGLVQITSGFQDQLLYRVQPA